MMKPCAAVCIAIVMLWAAGPAAGAAEGPPTLSEVFRRVDPAVVEIHTTEVDLPPGPESLPVSVSGLGSGVLITPDGKVLTAAHVVQTANAIEVEFLTGEVVKARVLSSEPSADVAVLQLEKPPRGPFVARLGDSDAVEIGAPVFVVGAPLGASHTLTAGHISARRKPNSTFSGMSRAEFFQTDASINQGNSGGPLFDMQGEVIGIVSHILSHSGGSEGLGFAVTSRVARQLLEQKSFWSGVNGFMLSGDLAQVFNVPPPGVGLLIQRVAAGSPAERLGLKGGTTRASIGGEDLVVGGDIILSILGTSLAEPNSLAMVRQKITALGPDEQVAVVVLRGGKAVTLTTQVPAQP
ncbi:MAG TPA: trypsin-like peptidase domain-containing protein [Candidatus Polarisedimenticolia bacterium]|jgi:S1-C subfamily serine protease|nr:trypsin-like peptidase domain-containing protein [Candidatus Polarisedimenticolia bacterium]